jgi:phage-related baseplate assembly protein
MEGGALAGEGVKGAVLAACNANEVRPLTDLVSVEDAEQTEYNVRFTYYTQTGAAKPAADIRQAVEEAVEGYTAWQSAKLGRDINPDELRERLYHTGIKRVVLAEPVFTVLKNDGKTPPQVAKLGTVTITNGGYEDE